MNIRTEIYVKPFTSFQSTCLLVVYLILCWKSNRTKHNYYISSNDSTIAARGPASGTDDDCDDAEIMGGGDRGELSKVLTGGQQC